MTYGALSLDFVPWSLDIVCRSFHSDTSTIFTTAAMYSLYGWTIIYLNRTDRKLPLGNNLNANPSSQILHKLLLYYYIQDIFYGLVKVSIKQLQMEVLKAYI